MDCHTIDLYRAERAVSFLTSDERRQEYQPKTLKQHNRGRHAYLPLFPTKSFGPNDCLLLANVPVNRLQPHEILRRQHGAYMMMNNYNYSDPHGFSLSEADAEELTVRLQVDMSIITFNADQLRKICNYLLLLHESFRRNVRHRGDVALRESSLNSKQMAIALEFFLQIDVDIFYMKTCSFRGAKPPSHIEGLFCGKDEPEAQYTMIPCSNVFCPCCHPVNNFKKSQQWPVVDFASSSMHQFVNGYTTYLNCPATCNTSNIIYTMTCPCGHYDFVDSTTETLAHAMTYHREHGNRIVHEKLTGTPVFRGSILDPNITEKQMANRMRLYQHSARCPIVLRSFLDCNPIYWCFIPLLLHEALTDNTLYVRGGTTSDEDPPEPANTIAMGAIDDHRVARYLGYVPLPPTTYAFSFRQRRKQRLFFESFLSSPIQQLPYATVDLYKVAIITVLPDDRSRILRYIIETLFIIHGETKLNMICPLGGNAEQRYGPAYELVWCANLNRLSM